jgi:acyl transferase domain-containing protein
MFSGIGEHYVNMAAQLYKEEPVFRREVDRCCDILEPILDKDPRDILYAAKKPAKGEGVDFRKLVGRDTGEEPLSEEEKVLSQTIYSQTSVFVVEYALARLFMSWGITPYAMIGYSVGEYTAACISGVFSLEHALFLVAHRAKLIHSVEKGAMLAVSLTEDELEPLLASVQGVSLAAKNTPDLCIVSGKLAGIDSLEKQLKEKKAIYRRLKSFQAFHSRMMEAVRPQLTALFEKVTINLPNIPYLSNVTGTWVTNEEVVTPGYWVRHTESPIRFSDGIGELLNTSCNFFLEIGPGNSLCGFIAQHPHIKNSAEVDRFVLASLPKESERVSSKAFLLRTLGKLWIAGMEIDWTSFYKHESQHLKRVPLPTYPFERKRYWLEPGMKTAKYAKDTKDKMGGMGLVAKKENINEWFYVPCWKQSVPPLAAAGQDNAAAERSWLVFLDESPVGGRFIQQLKLKKTGIENITVVRVGEGFEKVDEGVYTVNPVEYGDYAAVLEDLRAGDRGFDTVVHFWLLSPSPAVPDFMERGVYSLLHLVKAMGRQSMFDSLDLWVVGNHLHKIESSDMCSPGKAAVLGPCSVITQEYPNITCRSIDIGLYLYTYAHAPAETGGRYDEETAGVVETLLAEFTASPADRAIAYRGSTRWVQTFESLTPPVDMDGADSPPVLREMGVYFITGGLGKIGRTIARYLARTLRAKLVLTSRSGLHKPGTERELEEMGAEVLVVQADAVDKEQMEQALHLAEERFGTINGVIHAAGVMDESAFKLISDLDVQGCVPHFKTKIQGTIVLEQVFRDREPDFCMLTSSLSPILGGLSLYAYSAANGFMDAFARQQALVNRKPWISVNWADWQKEEEEEKNTPAGANVGTTVAALNITAEEGKETFRRVLAFHKLPQVVISSGDLLSRLQQWVLTGPGKGEAGAGADGGLRQPKVHQRPQLQSIFEAPGNEPEKIVAEIWQELLGIDLVGVHDNFFELGGHSLIATRLISRLREIFRIDIPLPTLFDRPTIRELLENIVDTWGDMETVDEIARTYREVQEMV